MNSCDFLRLYGWWFCFRPRRLQLVHLSPAARIYWYRLGIDVPAVRSCDLGQGVHRQTNKSIEVFRFRVVRQRVVRSAGHRRDERLPDRHQTTQGAAEEGQRRLQTVLAKETASRFVLVHVLVHHSTVPVSCAHLRISSSCYLYELWDIFTS